MTAIAGLDRIDRHILRLLQQDAQITNLDLSARVHLSPAACLRPVSYTHLTLPTSDLV